MANHLFGMMDMAIVGVPVAIFCIWQLISVNREIGRDRTSKDARSKEAARHPVGEHGEHDG